MDYRRILDGILDTVQPQVGAGSVADDKGNSVAGVEALDAFTTQTGWSVF